MSTVITDDEARDNLAANLKAILTARGLTQQQLADATDSPLMSINNAFHARNRPGAAIVARMAEALGYASEELLGTPARIAAREMLAARQKKSLIPA